MCVYTYIKYVCVCIHIFSPELLKVKINYSRAKTFVLHTYGMSVYTWECWGRLLNKGNLALITSRSVQHRNKDMHAVNVVEVSVEITE